jgi:DnaJ-class molecular chaperone
MILKKIDYLSITTTHSICIVYNKSMSTDSIASLKKQVENQQKAVDDQTASIEQTRASLSTAEANLSIMQTTLSALRSLLGGAIWGHTNCADCNGTGYTKHECVPCHGYGAISVPCPECKGEGEVLGYRNYTGCSYCYAEKFITNGCDTCGGNGKEKCVPCQGNGMIKN